jgi:hypothetical protein
VPDGIVLRAPDGNCAGLDARCLTCTFGDHVIVNRPGAVDLNVYEGDFGGLEFEFLDVRARLPPGSPFGGGCA